MQIQWTSSVSSPAVVDLPGKSGLVARFALRTGALVVALHLLIQTQWVQAAEGEVAPVQMLENFISTLDAFESSFEQTLYGSDSAELKTSVGTVKLKRPARFVWTYSAPEPQVIVADGERIWLYDEELAQVTVNSIDDRIKGTPLQVLMREAPLDEGFDVESVGASDGIDWFSLKPQTPSSDFEQVFIGLQSDAIAAMELRDNFGQATQIRFSDFDKSVELDDSLFIFDVPEGVDVIGLDE